MFWSAYQYINITKEIEKLFQKLYNFMFFPKNAFP